MRTLLPEVHPRRSRAFKNAATRARLSWSSEVVFMSTPIRRIRSGCCARATNGQAAAPPTPAMNSRRLIDHLVAALRQPIVLGAACLADLPIFFCNAGGGFWPISEMAVARVGGRLLGYCGRGAYQWLR